MNNNQKAQSRKRRSPNNAKLPIEAIARTKTMSKHIQHISPKHKATRLGWIAATIVAARASKLSLLGRFAPTRNYSLRAMIARARSRVGSRASKTRHCKRRQSCKPFFWIAKWRSEFRGSACRGALRNIGLWPMALLWRHADICRSFAQ